MDDFVPGSAALLESLDKRVLVVLRDGRSLVGTFGTYDQFGNIVMLDTVERIIVGHLYAEIPIGFFIIRGENVVLLGDLDESRETEILGVLAKTEDIDQLKTLQKAAVKQQRDEENKKLQVLAEIGFCTETVEGDYY